MISIDLNSVSSQYINWQALVEQALAGEKISIQKSGVEVAHITPAQTHTQTNAKTKPLQNKPVAKKRQFGFMAGQISYPDDINWGDDEVLSMFEESATNF